jgi:hypothetical protein
LSGALRDAATHLGQPRHLVVHLHRQPRQQAQHEDDEDVARATCCARRAGMSL